MQDPAVQSDRSKGHTEVKDTTCYMCACRCGIRVHLRDGQVRYIEGNPDHPLNHGLKAGAAYVPLDPSLPPARLTNMLDNGRVGLVVTETALRTRLPENPRTLCLDAEAATIAAAPEDNPIGRADPLGPVYLIYTSGSTGMPKGAGVYHHSFVNLVQWFTGAFRLGADDRVLITERAKLFVMIGTAEDHHSNPLKIQISKFKRRGGRFVSVNPIRTGYSAIADEWVPMVLAPGWPLLLALIHENIKLGLFDRDFLIQYTNAAERHLDRHRLQPGSAPERDPDAVPRRSKGGAQGLGAGHAGARLQGSAPVSNRAHVRGEHSATRAAGPRGARAAAALAAAA